MQRLRISFWRLRAMNNYIALTKVLLKTGLNMSSMSMKRKKNGQAKKPMSPMANLILSLVICLPVAAFMGVGGYGIYDTMAAAGGVAAGYDMLVSLGEVMVLVFSIPYVLSVFFMSSDLQALLPLPLKPSHIIGAKFTSVLVYEYMIVLMFYAPLLIGFGIGAGAGAVFWIIAVCSIIFVPVTPLIYASFLSIIMMRLLKNVKNKEMIVTIGTFIMIFAIMAFSMSINMGTAGSADEGAQLGALADKMGSLSKFGVVFPNGILLTKALANSDLLMLLLYLLTVAALMAFFLLVSEKLYLGGVKGMHEGGSKKKKISREALMNATQAKNPKRTFMLKELKTLFRSPEYFTNCLMMPIIFPPIMLVSMLVPFFGVMKSKNGAEGVKEMLAGLSAVPSESAFLIVLLVVFALAALIASSNFTTCTCLSREGRGFIFMKCIPMSYRDQLEAKSWCGLLIGFAASVPYVLIIAIGAVVLMKVNVSLVLLALLVAFFTLMFCNYIQLWFDLRSPKLDWENEQGAVKQNYTTMISMFGVMILCGVLGVGAVLLYKAFTLPVPVIVAIGLGILIALSFLMRGLVLSYGERKLERLE